MSTSEFGKKIAEYQDDVLSVRDRRENDIDAVRERLFARNITEISPARGRMPRFVLAFAVVATGIFFLIVIRPWDLSAPGDDAPAANSVTGKWLNANAAEQHVAFGDRSKVILKKGSSARVISEDGHHVHFLLEKGEADVSVVHYTDTEWTLDCGPYRVDVIGTRFHLRWDPTLEVFQLALEAGSVKISGPMVESGRRISRKETFTANVAAGNFTVQSNERNEIRALPDNALDSAPAATPLDLDTGSASTIPEETIKNSGRVRQPHDKRKKSPGAIASGKPLSANTLTWQEMNRAGQFDEVVRDARAIGVSVAFREKPTAELMALGDAARLRKEWQLAHDSYLALRKREPGSRNAATAAFSIGRIAFDAQRDYLTAARWLETYLKEAPSGRLAREALGRLMEARQKSGNMDGARATAESYLQKYPSGPYAELARRLLDR